MDKRPVFLDMDPGIDDALAIAVLAAQPGLHVVGASAVHGNVAATQGARNFAALLSLAGLADVPVRVGAQRPLAQPVGYAPHIHGEDGVGGTADRLPRVELPPPGGARLLLEQSHTYAGDLEIVATGPLTTLALALLEDPGLAERVRRVWVMGGAFWCPGNITHAAEANIYHDPEAADLVFSAPWPVFVCGLDVTMQVLWEKPGIERLEARAAQSPFLDVLARMTRFYAEAYAKRLGRPACALHDPLVALCVTTPDLVETERVAVAVERTGTLTRGMTVPQPGGEPRPPLDVARAVDAPRAIDRFEAALWTYTKS